MVKAPEICLGTDILVRERSHVYGLESCTTVSGLILLERRTEAY